MTVHYFLFVLYKIKGQVTDLPTGQAGLSLQVIFSQVYQDDDLDTFYLSIVLELFWFLPS